MKERLKHRIGCGCSWDDERLAMCPQHNCGPQLYDALKWALGELESYLKSDLHPDDPVWNDYREASALILLASGGNCNNEAE